MFQELTKHDQDMLILGHLQAHKEASELFPHYGEFTERGSSRRNTDTVNIERISYHFANLPICRAFLFMHDLCIKSNKNVIKHYSLSKIEPRIQGSKAKIPKNINALSSEDIKSAVLFIKN